MKEMNRFHTQIPAQSRDDTSSIYSRTPDTAKDASPMTMILNLPIQTSVPEINLLDHQIAMAGGSTMVLETTRTRLKSCKKRSELSSSKLKEERMQQRSRQERENDFYRSCFKSFHKLLASIIDSTQDLSLQYHFNAGAGPPGDPRLLRTIIFLRVFLDKSRAEEVQAEREWEQQSDIPSARKPVGRQF